MGKIFDETYIAALGHLEQELVDTQGLFPSITQCLDEFYTARIYEKTSEKRALKMYEEVHKKLSTIDLLLDGRKVGPEKVESDHYLFSLVSAMKEKKDYSTLTRYKQEIGEFVSVVRAIVSAKSPRLIMMLKSGDENRSGMVQCMLQDEKEYVQEAYSKLPNYQKVIVSTIFKYLAETKK